MSGILPGDSKMKEYPVPCSSSAPLTVENKCRSFLPDVFFPLWKPPQAWGGAEGTVWPWVSLWVFSGGGGWVGRMALLYKPLCEMSKSKGSATLQA